MVGAFLLASSRTPLYSIVRCQFMAVRQGRYHTEAGTAMRGPSYVAYCQEATPTGLRSLARHLLRFVDHYLLGFLGAPLARVPSDHEGVGAGDLERWSKGCK